ncbi:hypothetical protein PENSPDRAFT_648751 [Peniophora sp. CONT]|nr:hypothetical protein PENSPDRAFT_648751 [Peniophora sp. CONT]
MAPNKPVLSEDRWCERCGKQSTMRCSGCGFAYYCSVECQKNNWKTHKNHCLYTQEHLKMATDAEMRDDFVRRKTEIADWTEAWKRILMTLSPIFLDVQEKGMKSVRENCIVFYLERRVPDPKNAALSFTLKDAKVMKADYFADIHMAGPVLNFPKHDAELFKRGMESDDADEWDIRAMVRYAFVHGEHNEICRIMQLRYLPLPADWQKRLHLTLPAIEHKGWVGFMRDIIDTGLRKERLVGWADVEIAKELEGMATNAEARWTDEEALQSHIQEGMMRKIREKADDECLTQ